MTSTHEGYHDRIGKLGRVLLMDFMSRLNDVAGYSDEILQSLGSGKDSSEGNTHVADYVKNEPFTPLAQSDPDGAFRPGELFRLLAAAEADYVGGKFPEPIRGVVEKIRAAFPGEFPIRNADAVKLVPLAKELVEWVSAETIRAKGLPLEEWGKIPDHLIYKTAIDSVVLGNGQILDLYPFQFRGIPRECGQFVCPRASPEMPVQIVAAMESRLRSMNLLKADEAAWWVGDQATLDHLCECALNGMPSQRCVPQHEIEMGQLVEPTKLSPSQDARWEFPPGEAVYLGVRFAIKGKQWKVLKLLAEARRALTWTEIADDVSPETSPGQSAIRAYVFRCRKTLRMAFKLTGEIDPIPNIEWGDKTSWKIDTEVLRSATQKPR